MNTLHTVNIHGSQYKYTVHYIFFQQYFLLRFKHIKHIQTYNEIDKDSETCVVTTFPYKKDITFYILNTTKMTMKK